MTKYIVCIPFEYCPNCGDDIYRDTISPYQIIETESLEKAVEIYREKNGTYIGRKIEIRRFAEDDGEKVFL